ncbi:MAG: hypothetical protein AB4062_19435, partial [Crocosphaera sp.]
MDNYITSEQEKTLKKLAWSIEASEGEFKLIFAHCNYVNLQQCFSELLQELCDIEILYIQSTDKQLYTVIKNQIKGTPKAIQLLGLDQVTDLEEVLKSAERVRNDFKKKLPYTLVIWVNNKVQNQLRKVAPNFESWGVIISLPITVDYINNFLQDKVSYILNSPIKLSHQAVNRLNQEVIAAKEYLIESDGEVEFYLNFLLGYLEEVKRNFEQAIAYYQEAKKNLESCSLSELFKVGLWVHLTYCSYVHASHIKEIEGVDKWKETQEYLEKTLAILKVVNNRKLIAKFLGFLANVLIEFQYWDQLEQFAKSVLMIHRLEKNYYRLAQDYGFLAEVYLSKKRFNTAISLGGKGLTELNKLGLSELKSLQSLQRSKLLLIIGQGTAKLGQTQLAINSLEDAKSYNLNLDEPNVYIEILAQLHQLYFEKEKDYLEAFKIRQEIVKIKRKVGQFAFIGISKNDLPIITDEQDTIAPEIIASGRENDVNNLVERILRTDYKVIVIYGKSGVGKSSLVNGGFIPCLRSKSLAEGKIFPIYIRVYSNWDDKNKEENLLHQLRTLVNQKFFPVLIFDQFEEFFFFQTTTREQHNFFNFLGKCLELSNVKIVFSLRKEDIHYLLDIPGMDKISNDILGKEVLYKIGDFTPQETKDIIYKMTETSQFKLDDDLIDKLVEDLTEDDRIRPIELQIVGSQLQQENITTLAKYYQINRGTETRNYKEKLVQDFLDDIVKGCGTVNEVIADLILYLLTDDKGTRLIKTRETIEQELQDFQGLSSEVEFTDNQLNLVLDILVISGLVIRLKEKFHENYQLWHDYFVRFIREKQEPKIQAILVTLEKERKKRLSAEKSLEKVEREIYVAATIKQQLEKQNRNARKWVKISGGISLSFLLTAVVTALWITQIINDANMKIAKSDQKDQQSEIKAKEAKAKVEGANQKLAQAQQDELIATREHQKTKKRLTETNKELKKSKQELGKKKKKIQKLENDKQELEKNTQELANEVQEKQKKTQALQQQIDVRESKKEQVQEQIEQGEQKHKDAKKSYLSFTIQSADKLRTQLEENLAVSNITKWEIKIDLQQAIETAKEDNGFKGRHEHESWVSSVVFNPYGNILASSSDDGTIKLWDTSTGQLIKTLPKTSSSVNTIAFSPNGNILASGNYDGTIKLWDTSTGQLIKT